MPRFAGIAESYGYNVLPRCVGCRGVPARAALVGLVLNLMTFLFIGTALATVFAIAGFRPVHKDRPAWPRHLRHGDPPSSDLLRTVSRQRLRSHSADSTPTKHFRVEPAVLDDEVGDQVGDLMVTDVVEHVVKGARYHHLACVR